MKRSPIRRVSNKRAAALRQYSKLRKAYLLLHPFCEATIKLEGVSEEEVIKWGGWLMGKRYPYAAEIHHRARRYGSRLNDTTRWLAVSREIHERIHREPKWARANGLLDNY